MGIHRLGGLATAALLCMSAACDADTPEALFGPGATVTEAGRADLAALCAGEKPYPAQWDWDNAQTRHQPAPATGGTPRIEQYHVVNGRKVLVAIWETFGGYGANCVEGGLNREDTAAGLPAVLRRIAETGGRPLVMKGCGPFATSHSMRAANDGDLFLVYPAVYSGFGAMMTIAPNVDTDAEYSAAIRDNQANIWKAKQAEGGRSYGDALEAASGSHGAITMRHDFPQIPITPPFGHPIRNVTIRGVTQNGVRPVIVPTDGGGVAQAVIAIGDNTGNNSPLGVQNLTIENLDIENRAHFGWLDAVIKIRSGTNLTFRDMRITGFRGADGSGVQGIASQFFTAGTIKLENIEAALNGGVQRNGTDAHNFYFGYSAWDPDFTVSMTNSWTHDAFYGHLFKSRAQNTILQGNYFEGRLPDSAAGFKQGEAYLADLPNGGTATIRNNVFVKNRSGYNSNGVAITYAMEGGVASEGARVTIEHNTFVSFTRYFDDQRHPNVPMVFGYPQVVPEPGGGVTGLTGFAATGGAVRQVKFSLPANAVHVRDNVFVGYCPVPDRNLQFLNFRGQSALIAGFADLNPDFSLKHKVAGDTAIIGTPDYTHAAQPGGVRRAATVGARD